MILSYKHKYIFIKTRKCATSSIEHILSKDLGPRDICTGSDNDGTVKQNAYKINPHISAEEIKDKYTTDIWNSFYKFTVVRNPFDTLVSFYYFHKKIEPYNPLFQHNFEYFIKTAKLEEWNDWYKITINNNIAVDDVYYYENLSHLEKCPKLPNLSKLRTTKIKSQIRPTNSRYKQYYNTEMIDLINNKFRLYLEKFDYSF